MAKLQLPSTRLKSFFPPKLELFVLWKTTPTPRVIFRLVIHHQQGQYIKNNGGGKKIHKQSYIVKWKLHEEEKSSSPLLDAPPFPLSIAELLRNLPFSHRPSLKTVASRFKHHDRFIKCIMCPVSSETLQRNLIFRRSFDKHIHATTRKLTNIRPSNGVEAKITT